MRGVRAFVHEERLQRFAMEERTEQKSMLNLCSGKCTLRSKTPASCLQCNVHDDRHPECKPP